MGILNKLKKKADKSTQQETEKQAKKDLTLAELKESGAESKKDSKSKSTKPATKSTALKTDTKAAYRILIKPLITEKGTYLAGQNKYLFEVSIDANKIEIKKAVEAVYGVKPVAVNIVPIKGKKVRYGKVHGTTKNRKKAIISLKKGESIQVYEGV